MFIRKLFSLLLKLLFIKVNIYFKNHLVKFYLIIFHFFLWEIIYI